jgi:hypothetical protein
MSVDAILREVEALSVAERTEFMTRLRERFVDVEISEVVKESRIFNSLSHLGCRVL